MRRGMPALVVLLLAAGCGEEPGPSAAKDRRAVQVRAATYVRAYLAGDGERACRQFTPALRRVSELRAKQGGLTCASALALVGPQLLAAVPALEFLVAHLAFLYAPGRYRFVDSGSSESFGDAYLVLESDTLRLRLIRDRSQLFMDFGPLKGKDWFSIDVVRRLITGERQESAELSPDYAAFLKRELGEIERRFGPGERGDTVRALKELERVRAKELFG